MSPFSGERLYEASISCDIDYVSVAEEKLAGVDQALAELGKSDAEVSEVRERLACTTALDLEAVDGELGALSEGVSIAVELTDAPATNVDAPAVAGEGWEDELTDVELMDESDFVLLVDEDDLEELEKAGEDEAQRTNPASPPDVSEPVEGEGSFFKKLFGGRRNSSNP